MRQQAAQPIRQEIVWPASMVVPDFQLCGFIPQAARDRDNRRDGDERRRHVDGRGQPSGRGVQRHLKSFDHHNPLPRMPGLMPFSCRHHKVGGTCETSEGGAIRKSDLEPCLFRTRGRFLFPL